MKKEKNGNGLGFQRLRLCFALGALATICALASGCVEPGPDNNRTGLLALDFQFEYQLNEIGQMAAEENVVGLASDGATLWVAYRDEVGGFYDPDVVRLVQYDRDSLAPLAEFRYDDEYIAPTGLAFDGESLWLNYAAITHSAFVKQIDPADGTVLRQFVTYEGAHGLDFDGSNLLVSDIWNRVHVVDRNTGGLVANIDTPFEDSTVRGLAYHKGNIWLVSQASNLIVVMNAEGGIVARVPMANLDPEWNYAWDLYMTSLGNELVFVKNGHITFYEIDRIIELDSTPL